MSRFAVYMYQSGGCDYTIGCGHLFILLPETIQTMKEAIKYVSDNPDDGGEKGNLCYHGRNRIDKCVVHEITNSFEVNIHALQQEDIDEQLKIEKEKRRQQFEALKEEFQ